MASRVVAKRVGRSLTNKTESPPFRKALLTKQHIKQVPMALRQTPLLSSLLQHHSSMCSTRKFSTLKRFRDFVLQRANPVLAALSPQDNSADASAEGAFADKRPVGELPNFGIIEPYHFESAARLAQATYEESLRKHTIALPHNPSYDDLVPELERIEAPLRILLNMSDVFRHVKQDPLTQIGLDAASKHIENDASVQSTINDALKSIETKLLQGPQDDRDTCTQQRLWAVNFLLDEYNNAGLNLDEENQQELQEIRSELEEMEAKFTKPAGERQARSSTREKLQDIYYILSLREQEANCFGYDSYNEMIFHSNSRMASSVQEVQTLHKQIAERVQPVAASQLLTAANEDLELHSYLTLDGILGGLFGLSRALFAMIILEDKDEVHAWHPDVRLFHVFDEEAQRYLGSFYLDPYRRQIKSNQPLVAPIYDKTNLQYPVVCLSCDLRPPVWDHMPTAATIDNARSLFHEFGHVLQYLLVERDEGGIFGAQNIQVDCDEIIPQFMEHWLFQDSVLQSLAQLSHASESIPADLLVKLKNHQRVEKAHEMIERIFLSELEISLFSGSRDGRSVVELLKDAARRYREHDPLHQSDMSPILELLEENVRGQRVTRYRYLWSEVLSADLFLAFQEVGLENEEGVKRLGRQFKRLFLNPGASVDTRQAFRGFRGRDVSTSAFLDMYRF